MQQCKETIGVCEGVFSGLNASHKCGPRILVRGITVCAILFERKWAGTEDWSTFFSPGGDKRRADRR
jgi:hypothetical protein